MADKNQNQGVQIGGGNIAGQVNVPNAANDIHVEPANAAGQQEDNHAVAGNNNKGAGINPNIQIELVDIAGPANVPNAVNNVHVEPANAAGQQNERRAVVDNNITITDERTPIILLFGPFSSGKSMTLVRLAKYLRKCGYQIVPDYNFKPGEAYRELCDNFMRSLDSTKALGGTPYDGFLLIKVSYRGKTICQFLEAPGEHYFDRNKIDIDNFPAYMTNIIVAKPNRKIWVFLTEANWNVDYNVKQAYVRRIANCQAQLVSETDRFVILYNMVDRKQELYHRGQLNVKEAENAMRGEYQGLAELFTVDIPLVSILKPYDYKFVPFCTGHYSGESKPQDYVPSNDFYPKAFWDVLEKCIRG